MSAMAFALFPCEFCALLYVFFRLMVQGYKKTLTETDVYDLHPREQSAGVIERFDKVVQRTKADMSRDFTGSSYQNGTVRYIGDLTNENIIY